MKLIKPMVELVPQTNTYLGLLEHIEKAGRVCYKSEDNIAKGTAEKMFNFLNTNKHRSVFEHATVYLHLTIEDIGLLSNPDSILALLGSKYTKYEIKEDGKNMDYYITTNLRVVVESKMPLDVLKTYMVEPTEFHPKRSTFRIICSRVQSQSYQRHRIFSYSQESTRYCDYSKGKFDSEVSYILPDVKGISLHPGRYRRLLNDPFILFTDLNGYTYKIEYNNPEDIKDRTYLNSLLSNEKDYFALKNLGMPAEDARDVLSFKLKTEFFMTGFDEDWLGNFKELRTAKPAHHEIRKQVEEIVKIVENKK